MTGVAQRAGAARRLGGHAPVQPLRAPADHCARPLPAPRRPAAVRRPPRADLRAARPRRGRRPGEGDPGRERPARPTSRRCSRSPRAPRSGAASPPASPRQPADGLRGVPALGPAAALPATTPTTPRSSASSSGPGCIADYTHIWWDIRLHPRLGTVEIRICDAVTQVEDAVAITAYCQALVKPYSERFDGRQEIPSYHRILTTENKWLAARYGLEAPVMDLATGSRNRVPVAQLIRRTLKELEPHARELGGERELEGIARDPRARATAQTGSAASSTRTATSSRSCARSRTRPSTPPSASSPTSRHPALPARTPRNQPLRVMVARRGLDYRLPSESSAEIPRPKAASAPSC